MLYSPALLSPPTAPVFVPIASPSSTVTATNTHPTVATAAAAAFLFRIMSPFDSTQHHYSIFPVAATAASEQDDKPSGRNENNSGGGDGINSNNYNNNNNSDPPFVQLNMMEEPPPPLPVIVPTSPGRSVFSMQNTLDSLYDEWVSIHIVFRSLQSAFPARPPPAEREEEYLDEIDRELSITYDDLMAQVRRLHRNLNRLAREMAQYSVTSMDPRYFQP